MRVFTWSGVKETTKGVNNNTTLLNKRSDGTLVPDETTRYIITVTVISSTRIKNDNDYPYYCNACCDNIEISIYYIANRSHNFGTATNYTKARAHSLCGDERMLYMTCMPRTKLIAAANVW